MNFLKSIGLAWLQYREFNKVLAELESYTDRELNGDLRIDRADFAHVAYEEAERRVAVLRAERPQPARERGGYAALFDTVRPLAPFARNHA